MHYQNQSLDSSQASQKLCKFQSQMLNNEDIFYAPQTRMFQSAQSSAQQMHSQKQQSKILGSQNQSFFAIK